MLINKPQFDPNEIKKGQAYLISYSPSKFNSLGSYGYKDYDERQLGKLEGTIENVLVLAVEPLKVILTTVGRKEVVISVNLVAKGVVTLNKLIPDGRNDLI